MKSLILKINHSTGFILISAAMYLCYLIFDYELLRSVAMIQFISGYVVMIISMGIRDSIK